MIRVSLCCNDGRNGAFTGRFEYIKFTDHREFQACLYGPETRLKFLKNRVRISRRIFEVVPGSYRYGVGNWCWDGVAMSQGEALKLLDYLLLSRGFEPEDWDDEGPFAGPIKFAQALRRQRKADTTAKEDRGQLRPDAAETGSGPRVEAPRG